MFHITNVTSRANSDMLSIDLVIENTRLSSVERMARILQIAKDYENSVSGGRFEHLTRTK